MLISGRSCMSFYTRQTKIRCMRCVRCLPVDAYLYATFKSFVSPSYASHVAIADDAGRTMRISGRSCMSFYTRQTKMRCVRCVRCLPVDAYLYATFIKRLCE
ncbi:hypothetical protein SFRURICE_015329 [Spodoptera frugiperda]|nr:hypothetical protein SFRURICE_015329 [Spodoptera frugiperda]